MLELHKASIQSPGLWVHRGLCLIEPFLHNKVSSLHRDGADAVHDNIHAIPLNPRMENQMEKWNMKWKLGLCREL